MARKARVKILRGTRANIANSNVKLEKGELLLDTDDGYLFAGLSEGVDANNASNILKAREVVGYVNDSATLNGSVNPTDKKYSFGYNSSSNKVEIDGVDSISFNKDIEIYRLDGNGSSIKIGKNIQSDQDYSVAIGENINISEGSVSACYATAIGYASSANGSHTIAIGTGANSSKERAISIGVDSNSSGNSSVSIGNNSLSGGSGGVAIGNNSKSTKLNSIAIGSESNVSSSHSIGIGGNAKASNMNSIACGTYANASGASSLSVGLNSVSIGDNSIALGQTSKAIGFSSISVGSQSNASGCLSTVVGYWSESNGVNSVAIGAHAGVTANYSVQLGSGTNSNESTLQFINTKIADGSGNVFTGFSKEWLPVQNTHFENNSTIMVCVGTDPNNYIFANHRGTFITPVYPRDPSMIKSFIIEKIASDPSYESLPSYICIRLSSESCYSTRFDQIILYEGDGNVIDLSENCYYKTLK